uniref:Bifunctional sesquiterpene synthase 1 n=1 Tax=Phyla dulcis TaxID=542674 RepID=TPS1_PHYDL|nr:RecName: Full=Bifunctional sesquiterpene synthase 1; AltName: Full=Alpha-copaene synthase; AltName: Full=Delta-cadinene synthase; AltName: Full=Terpene synthase 1; Short=LdTPS1 [Phyla dulcis]AFR23368.1 alpha-copaene/delta-cadinene synthase [Phyla dulcis]
MALAKESSIVVSSSPDVTHNITRPVASYHPNVWGDRFLLSSSDQVQLTMKARDDKVVVDELKKEVRRKLKEASNDYIRLLQTVDVIQRLGLAYHFEEEIDQALRYLFETFHDYSEDSQDMYANSLSFRLLRQHGYRISCEIFEKFKDANGGFKIPNIEGVMGMLEFYEATHLRVRGEDILDHGFVFSRNYLKSVLPSLSNPLAAQVDRALNQNSNRRGLPRLEARHFMSVYEQYASHDQALLKLAKLNFNILQSLHKVELSEISRWWKGVDIARNFPYARDRIVELYFWVLGVYFEPQYAVGRKITTKVIAIASLLDDTFDAYGTFEELRIFAEAVERWSVSCLDQLPEYMKLLYKTMLEVSDEIEEEMTKLGTPFRIAYGIEAIKTFARSYFLEAKWREEKYKPTTEEYMGLATKTCGYKSLIITSFLAMGDIPKREHFDWVLSDPDFVMASCIICRLADDIVGHEFEQTRDHIPSSVECYTQEHKTSKEDAVNELYDRLESAWKDLNEGFLRPTKIPAALLYRVLNYCRIIEVMYSRGDWYTHVGPEMQGFVRQLLVDPVPE